MDDRRRILFSAAACSREREVCRSASERIALEGYVPHFFDNQAIPPLPPNQPTSFLVFAPTTADESVRLVVAHAWALPEYGYSRVSTAICTLIYALLDVFREVPQGSPKTSDIMVQWRNQKVLQLLRVKRELADAML